MERAWGDSPKLDEIGKRGRAAFAVLVDEIRATDDSPEALWPLFRAAVAGAIAEGGELGLRRWREEPHEEP